jgi:hypothetical protein
MYIDFTICSEENKLIFLKELFPNSTLLMKDDLLISGKKIPYNEFNITFELDFFYYIDDMIRSFKNFINNEKKFLCDFIQTNNLKSSLCIVIKKTDELPGISISNENLNFLTELNANIDIDFI